MTPLAIQNCKSIEQLNALAALMNNMGRLSDDMALLVADKMAEFMPKTEPQSEPQPKQNADELVELAIAKGKEIADKTGLSVRRSGYYIYITGETKPQKEYLKQQGCRWHKKQECWYYAPSYPKYRGKKNYSSRDQIVNKYGEETIN